MQIIIRKKTTREIIEGPRRAGQVAFLFFILFLEEFCIRRLILGRRGGGLGIPVIALPQGPKASERSRDGVVLCPCPNPS